MVPASEFEGSPSARNDPLPEAAYRIGRTFSSDVPRRVHKSLDERYRRDEIRARLGKAAAVPGMIDYVNR
jgi:hypothetical protein